jgi:hypothetical protein
MELTAQILGSLFIVKVMSINLRYTGLRSGTSQYHVHMSQMRSITSQQSLQRYRI